MSNQNRSQTRSHRRDLRQGVIISLLLLFVLGSGYLLTWWAEVSGLTDVKHHYALLLFTYGGPLLLVIVFFDKIDGLFNRRKADG